MNLLNLALLAGSLLLLAAMVSVLLGGLVVPVDRPVSRESRAAKRPL